MKYTIIEGKAMGDQKYHALGKARNDVNIILKNNRFKPINFKTKNGIQKNKYKKIIQYLQYYKNYKIWKKEIKRIKENKKDWYLIQYPLMNNTLFFPKLLKQLSLKVNTIVLIHDMDSIRFKDKKNSSYLYKKRINYEDQKVGKYATKIISHNESMTSELIKLGVEKKKIINLKLFDYLASTKEIAQVKYKKEVEVVIAGNLLLNKAKYLSELKNISKVKFNLYGVNYDEKKCSGKNINYKGVFPPDKLINNLSGMFGLVWDGNSTETCNGVWGNYLKYNNPHKVSLYLSAGLPVIVWRKSALASFITKNNLGIAVNSVHEIYKITSKISKKDYEEMCSKVNIVSKKLKNGYYLKNALNKIIDLSEGD